MADGHTMRVRRIRGVRERYLAAWASEPAVRDLDQRLVAAGGAWPAPTGFTRRRRRVRAQPAVEGRRLAVEPPSLISSAS